MKLITLALLVLVAALTIATAANAAPALRIIGNSSSSGDFAVTAASAEKDNAAAIYVRGTGRDLSGFGVVACSRGIASIGSKTTTIKHMVSGKMYRLKQPFKGDCQITASLSGEGRIKLHILA
jgi:hypothetical protein